MQNQKQLQIFITGIGRKAVTKRLSESANVKDHNFSGKALSGSGPLKNENILGWFINKSSDFTNISGKNKNFATEAQRSQRENKKAES